MITFLIHAVFYTAVFIIIIAIALIGNAWINM